MNRLLTFILISLSTLASAQVTLEGFVRAGDNGEPIPQVYVVNLTTEESATSNTNGFFSIEMSPTDTLLLSHISFTYQQYALPDIGDEERWITVIKLEPRSYLLEEIEVVDYQISTNRPRPMVLEEPNVPFEEDVVYPETSRRPGISSPISLLYWYFGSRPRQLRELQRLKEEDAYRRQLELGTNREILQEVTGLSPEELEAFVWTCKYGDVPISTLNDYDLLVSLLRCYAEYVDERAQQDVLDDAQNGW